MKVFVQVLTLVLSFPLVAFVILYSADMGCFVCLDGEERGGSAEKWINLTLIAAVVGIAGAMLWNRVRSGR